MFNRPHNTVLARLGLVAAILATLMILAPVASAADPYEVDYLENGTDPVGTFNADDEDADAGDPEWDLSGPDEKDFDISSDGVLTFKKAPNFEKPTDRDEDKTASGLQGFNDNVYKVTVEALDGDLDVVVTVKNVDEAGSVSFDKPQPQVTRELTASFKDDDGMDNPRWAWSKSMDKDAADADWVAISGKSAKRTPKAEDIDYYLRATVTYEDSYGAKTVSGVTDNVVEKETLANAAPKFGTVDPLELDENVSGTLGDPILASDADGDELQLALDGATAADNALFSYNASGQLSVKDEDGLDYEGHVTASGGTREPHVDDTATTDDDHIPVGALTFTVKIKATDPSGAVGRADVTVYLKDVNEAPKFGDASGDANQKTLYVDEGATPALRVGMTGAAGSITYSATDEDGTVGTTPGTTDAVAYSIEGADAKYFGMDASTGALTPIATLPDPNPDEKVVLAADFEDKDSYSITIVATSTRGTGDDAVRMYATLAVTVKVVDGEDPGTASFSGGVRVPEVGRPVLATHKDPDGGITGAKWQWFRGSAPPAGADAAARAAARTTLITTLAGLLDGTLDDPDAGTNRVCGDDGNTTTVDATAGGSTACVINGATSSLYTPSAAEGNSDVGFTIHALVTYTDAQSATATDRAIVSSEGPVQDRDPANTAPKFPDQDLNKAGDQSDTAMRSVDENKDKINVGEPIPADDAETDPKDLLIYTLNGADAANFTVDNNGQIKTKVKLDFETQPMHTVVLTATDPSGASDSITVMITVIDGPDDAVITGVKTFDFPEDRESLEVGTFNADDEDADAGDPEWDLSGPDEKDFDISSDGVLTFKKAPNFEKPTDRDEDKTASGLQGFNDNVYKVTVEALDGDLDVVVTVKNVDEAGSVSFDKPQPQVTRELTASFKDDDGMDNPRWAWSKSMDKDAADADWVAISGKSAKRTPKAEDIDYYLRATVTYEDSYGAKTVSGVTDNVVEKETLANAAPKFGTVDPLELDENVSGTLGDPILASDADGDELQLALDGATAADNALFSYNASGQLSVKDEDGLDYEGHVTASGGTREPHVDDTATTDDDHIPVGALTFTVKIKATDPSGAVGRADVTVYLKDVNEAPKFGDASGDANQKTLYVDEGATPALRVGMTGAAGSITYSATDVDGTVGTTAGTLDTVVLTIEGADAKYFDIDAGALTPIATLPDPNPDEKVVLAADFEDKDSYSITIVATSTGTSDATPPPAGGNRGSTYATLAVTVKVVDGEDPGTASFSGGVRVPEVGRPVLATHKDPDGGITGAKWQWFRGSAPPAGADAAARAAARTTLITTLAGLLDGTLDDPDAGTNRVCGDDGNTTTVDATAGGSTACVINGATSSLYTPSAAEGNSDVGFTIHALVTYTDAQSATATDRAIVSSEGPVQDRDPANTAPKFPDQDLNKAGDQSDTAMRSVDENKDKINVGEPIPADDAETDPKDLLIYTLNGADAANFTVDNNGQIKTKVKLDFETQPMHTVVLTATDPSGASDSITVMITVIDGPDDAVITFGPAVNTAPAFDEGDTADRMVDENMPMGTNVGDPVTATDEDAGQTLTYSLNGGGGNFEIDSATGQIKTTASLDYETTPSYPVTVTASDGQDMNSTATIDVTITVGDMNPGCKYVVKDTRELIVDLSNDCEVLISAMDELTGDGSLDWSEDTDMIRDWTGVVVAGETPEMLRVAALGLHGQGLTGTIPAGLGDLDALQILYLHRNNLHGMVPGELGSLTNLTMLRVDNNELEGIEEGLGGASSLVTFYAHRNHLKGSIPADLGNLDNLVWLRLDSQISSDRPDDGLTGSIPAELAGMGSIERIYLHRNKLSGTIPAELGMNTTLTHITLQQNMLSGNIPDLSGMTSLIWLGLYDNELSGSIPATLGMLSNLQRLYLHTNNLTGSVPVEIGNLTNLTNLWLENNNLDGALPNELDNLTNLERVRIAPNGFTGCVPAALANAASTDAADLGLETCSDGS